MVLYGACILVIEFHDEACEIVVFIESLGELPTDERQFEAEIILMACFEILHQCGYRQAVGIVELFVSIDGEVDNGKESVCVNMLLIANFTDGLVAKSKVYAKAAKNLQ